MPKSSKAITLALIGSSFLLGGCNRNDDENANQAVGGHGGGRGVFIGPRIGTGFGGGGGTGVSATPSARGGFGSTGASGVGS